MLDSDDGSGNTALTQFLGLAVFPNNAAPFDVLLRRLGAETLSIRGGMRPYSG